MTTTAPTIDAESSKPVTRMLVTCQLTLTDRDDEEKWMKNYGKEFAVTVGTSGAITDLEPVSFRYSAAFRGLKGAPAKEFTAFSRVNFECSIPEQPNKQLSRKKTTRFVPTLENEWVKLLPQIGPLEMTNIWENGDDGDDPFALLDQAERITSTDPTERAFKTANSEGGLKEDYYFFHPVHHDSVQIPGTLKNRLWGLFTTGKVSEATLTCTIQYNVLIPKDAYRNYFPKSLETPCSTSEIE